eukprot:1604930-Prymnesium_polylepis.1
MMRTELDLRRAKMSRTSPSPRFGFSTSLTRLSSAALMASLASRNNRLKSGFDSSGAVAVGSSDTAARRTVDGLCVSDPGGCGSSMSSLLEPRLDITTSGSVQQLFGLAEEQH